jgi:hypothetical protein
VPLHRDSGGISPDIAALRRGPRAELTRLGFLLGGGSVRVHVFPTLRIEPDVHRAVVDHLHLVEVESTSGFRPPQQMSGPWATVLEAPNSLTSERTTFELFSVISTVAIARRAVALFPIACSSTQSWPTWV